MEEVRLMKWKISIDEERMDAAVPASQLISWAMNRFSHDAIPFLLSPSQ
jgi:hypothetical protein